MGMHGQDDAQDGAINLYYMKFTRRVVIESDGYQTKLQTFELKCRFLLVKLI